MTMWLIRIAFTGHRGQIGKDFSYSVSANFTYARERSLHVEHAEYTSSMDRWLNGKENRNSNVMWLYKYDGQYTSLEQYETAPLIGGNLGNSKMLPPVPGSGACGAVP